MRKQDDGLIWMVAGGLGSMVLAVVLMVGVIGSAILDARAVQRGRITYFDEEPTQTGAQSPSDPPRPGQDQQSS